MERHHTRYRSWAAFALLLYLIILFKVIILKQLSFSLFIEEMIASPLWHGLPRPFEQINYVPLKTIRLYLNSYGLINQDIIIDNILGNLLLFAPLGMLMRLAASRRVPSFVLLLAGIFISLIFELLQYLSGFGIADIDDLLLNTIGHLLGLLFAIVVTGIWRKRVKKE